MARDRRSLYNEKTTDHSVGAGEWRGAAFEAKFEVEKVVFEYPVAGMFRLECQTDKVKLPAAEGAAGFVEIEAMSA